MLQYLMVLGSIVLAQPASAAINITLSGTSSGYDGRGDFGAAGSSWRDAETAVSFTIDETKAIVGGSSSNNRGVSVLWVDYPNIKTVMTVGGRSMELALYGQQFITGFWGDWWSETFSTSSYGAGNNYLNFAYVPPLGELMPDSFKEVVDVQVRPSLFQPYGSFTFGDIDGAYTSGVLAINRISYNSAVPEPATWLMMLVGFVVVGASLRLRDRKRLNAF